MLYPPKDRALKRIFSKLIFGKFVLRLCYLVYCYITLMYVSCLAGILFFCFVSLLLCMCIYCIVITLLFIFFCGNYLVIGTHTHVIQLSFLKSYCFLFFCELFYSVLCIVERVEYYTLH